MQFALEVLKNRNLYPVQVGKHVVYKDGGQVEMKMPWNNFPDVLYTFYVNYCYAQALTQSMSVARRVLMYVFYGSYTRKVKVEKTRYSITSKSILHGIHMKTACNRSRFTRDVLEKFKVLKQLLEARPELVSLLTDKGEGEAPVEYLAAVEMGLREYRDRIYCLGARPLRSAEWWQALPVWRKRECYIAFVRLFVYKLVTYSKWESFKWEDLVTHNVLHKTFITRHAPLSDGTDHFNGAIQNPAEWNEPKKRKAKRSSAANPKKTKRDTGSGADSDCVPLRFSQETGELVPCNPCGKAL